MREHRSSSAGPKLDAYAAHKDSFFQKFENKVGELFNAKSSKGRPESSSESRRKEGSDSEAVHSDDGFKHKSSSSKGSGKSDYGHDSHGKKKDSDRHGHGSDDDHSDDGRHSRQKSSSKRSESAHSSHGKKGESDKHAHDSDDGGHKQKSLFGSSKKSETSHDRRKSESDRHGHDSDDGGHKQKSWFGGSPKKAEPSHERRKSESDKHGHGHDSDAHSDDAHRRKSWFGTSSKRSESAHSSHGKKSDKHGFDSDAHHSDDGFKHKSSGGSSSKGGERGNWSSKSLTGLVMLTVEVKGGSDFPKRIAVKKDRVKITLFETSTPDSTKVRVFTAPAADILRDLGREFADSNCYFRASSDIHESVGTVKEVQRGRLSVQVVPSLDIENVYTASVYLGSDSGKGSKSKSHGTRSLKHSDDDEGPSPHKSKLSTGHKKPGPMSRLEDDSEAGSAASDSSRRQRKGSPSKSSSQKHGSTKKGHYDDLEVVGTSFSKGHGRDDEGHGKSKLSKQSSFNSDASDAHGHKSSSHGKKDSHGKFGGRGDDDGHGHGGHGKGKKSAGHSDDDYSSHKRSSSPRKSSHHGSDDDHSSHKSSPSPRKNQSTFDDENFDEDESRKAKKPDTHKRREEDYQYAKKSSSHGKSRHDDDDDRGHDSHSRKSSPSRKSSHHDDDEDDHGSHSRKASVSKKSGSGRHDEDDDDRGHGSHSRKSSPSRKSSSGRHDEDEDEYRVHDSHSRKSSSSRKSNSRHDDDEDDHGSHSRKSSNKKDGFFKSYRDDDDERENNGFAAASRESNENLFNPKHKTRSLGSDFGHGEDEYDEDEDWGSGSEGESGTRSLGGKGKAKPKSAFRTAQRFSANRPWAGAIVAPSNAQAVKTDVPREELVLEYVHGYRMRDVNNNAYYLQPGVIVFPAGSVGVVMDIKSNKQRFFQGRHKEDVTAITVHPSKKLVATGDVVSHNDGTYIYIWDPRNPEDSQRQVQIRVGEKKLAKGIADLQFSPDGRYLVAAAMDDDHMVYFYDWQKAGKLVAKEKGHTDSIFGITFNPKNPNEFVTFGIKHLKHWSFDESSGKLKGERGIFGSRKVSSIICCTYFPNNTYVTGAHSGELLFWNRNQVINIIEQVHAGPIFSVTFDRNIGLLSGGKDGMIVVHDPKSMETIDKVQLEAGVRSIEVGESAILVGLEDSIILEVKGVGSDRDKKVNKILEGHSAMKGEELWGCATDPRDNNVYVTSGDDSMVFKRSLSPPKTLASVRLQGKLRAINYSPDSKFIAVGNDNGDIYLLKSSDLSQVHFEKFEKHKGISTKIHAHEVIRFSPDGRYLAAAGHDMVVYIYEMSKKFKLAGICKGHSSFITHLDWSSDSSYLQTNSGDFELLFWSAPSGKQVTSASAMKDVEWATFSCVLGWPVQGIWEKGMEGDDINTVDRHPGQTCVASGDDFFSVRLHSYPAAKEGMPFKKYLAHGSHVTQVKFTARGDRLISTGGMDGCTFQWRVEGGGSSRKNSRRSDNESDAGSGSDGYES
ncbi:Echinoderm microtubule-associated protein-like 5 [Phlyctochytrium planicorne]|nr:Echinoderm microtubule-associated protein-like 5 [Phlyctochytrium planicorne]